MGHLICWQSYETPLVDKNDKEMKGHDQLTWALLIINGQDWDLKTLTQQKTPSFCLSEETQTCEEKEDQDLESSLA
ncbi:hypothetical protein Tco_0539043, partial [Tanacetum coccineum]